MVVKIGLKGINNARNGKPGYKRWQGHKHSDSEARVVQENTGWIRFGRVRYG